MRLTGLFITLLLVPCLASAAVVDINTASASLLDTLPGIGPSKAAAIIDYRTTHGPFVTIEDIQKVKGIGPSMFAKMKESLTTGAGSASVPVAQLSLVPTSYEKIQAAPPPATVKAKSITSDTNIQPHAEAVDAPTVATELAAVGAAVPVAQPTPRWAGLFSMWTLGLLGVIVVAGTAFILI